MPHEPRSDAPLSRSIRRGVSILALLIVALAPSPGSAQPASSAPPITERFNAAAVGGPGALLHALSQELAGDPSLGATPDSAAALARVAAAPVADFVGANTPVLRDIARQIIAAAPSDQRSLVEQAVNQALGTYAELDLSITPPVRPDTVKSDSAEPSGVGGTGYKMGSFTLYPDVQAATFYDDNIYATSHNHVSDKIITVSPRFGLQSDWDRHSLYIEGQTDVTDYLSHTSENSVDWHILTEGRIDVSDTTRILLGGVALHAHEDRASPDAVEGFQPTPYNELNAYTGIVHRFGDFSYRLGGSVERITFDNVLGQNGEINNQDRNRNRYTLGGLLRYEKDPNLQPFIQLQADIRRYDTVLDDFGYNRNSGGFLAGAGTLFIIEPNLSGDVFVGVLSRKYQDPVFNAITTPAADATLRWQAKTGTALVLFTERTIEETTLPGSPGNIYSLGGLRIEQTLSERLTGVVRVAYAHSDFVQAGRNDNEIDSSIGLRHRLTEKLTLGIDYRYTQRLSGNSLYDFTRNQVYVRIGADF